MTVRVGAVRLLLLCWAVGYGTLRAYWAAGHRPWVAPLGGDLLQLSGWGAVVLCAAAGVVAAVAGVRWLPRAVRWGVVAVGTATAVALVAAPFLLLLDVVALVFPGVGIPFSWLGFASRLGCLVGGLLTAQVVRTVVRELRGGCARCGRRRPTAAPARTPWWALTAAGLAVAGCLTRFVAQGLVGFSAAPAGYSEAAVAGLGFVVAAGAAGTLLPIGLIHPWGRRLPRWLLLGPAAFVAGGLTIYFGVGALQLAVEGAGVSETETGLPAWFFWLAEPAYLVWGLGLGVAAAGYWLRTRPTCSACGSLPNGTNGPQMVAERVGDEVGVDRG